MSKILKISLIFVVFSQIKCESPVLPIVLWHGMGDTCCFPFSLGHFKKTLEAEIPNVYVRSIEIGGNIFKDFESGYFIHPMHQLDQVCESLTKDPKLKNGFHAVGFSQGGLFLRTLQQNCPGPLPMRNLISFGGPQQGVFGLPACPSLTSKTCEYLRESLNFAAYTSYMQDYLVQATYWHDPLHEEKYRNFSSFLAYFNGETSVTFTEAIYNLQQLQKLVLVKFLNDTIVVPRESEWFGFYRPGQDKEVVGMEETRVFKEDLMGLKKMKENGQLVMLATEGDHLQFTKEWFMENILPYLK
ncbi:palmitoyl-protein thioesterase 1 [Culicoides brevitarsis]|uniref:palmitoyl-protein thioesterase 1 n=1 Tax=Culicoides brevitarsis TaxID=469753 RepID=UPI00307B9320